MKKYTAYTWLPRSGESQGRGNRRRRVTSVLHFEAETGLDAIKFAAAAHEGGRLGKGELTVTGRTRKYDHRA